MNLVDVFTLNPKKTMQLTTYLCTALILATAFSSAAGQVGERVRGSEQDIGATSQSRDVAIETAPTTDVVPDSPVIWIHLVGGRRLQVDEVTEGAEGIWYKLGNVSTFLESARVARIERVSPIKSLSLTEPLPRSVTWRISDSPKVESFFLGRFGRNLPLGAFGQSYLHTRWGLDHRNGMDVSLHPDSPEGRALIRFLRNEGIPYLPFRGPIPGVATGPHIHVGNASHRLSGRR
ncbi:hypothetical protein BH20ACI3_BH20ACI3_24170 [soil metagenome]